MEGQSIERLREILTRLRDERKIVRQELFEIETWLNTVGKKATHKNDKAVRTQFMKDKDRLIKKTHSLKVEIKEYADAIEQMVEEGAGLEVAGHTIGGRIRITDHAIVRWMERKHGLNMTAIKAEMYTDMMKASMTRGTEAIPNKRGCVAVRTDDGMTYVTDPVSGIIVTCYKTAEWKAEQELEQITQGEHNYDEEDTNDASAKEGDDV